MDMFHEMNEKAEGKKLDLFPEKIKSRYEKTWNGETEPKITALHRLICPVTSKNKNLDGNRGWFTFFHSF